MSSSIIRRASLPAIMLGGFLLATSAHAQITSAAVGTWASNNNVVTLGGGSSRTISEFKSDIESAFTANIGGTIAFDTVTSGATGDQTSIVSTYNGGNSTLTIAVTGGSGTVNISSSGLASSGGQFMGVTGTAVSRTFTFSSALSEFGLVVTSRGAGAGARTGNLSVTLQDNSTITLTARIIAETGDNTLFNYQSIAGNNIVSATLFMPDGAIRPDDFGFVVASAIPEPSTYGIVAGGLVLVGAMVRRRRAKA
jgi:hypothetical protein